MLSFLIIFILFCSFFIGKRRGFILQLVYLISFILAWYVAFTYFKDVAEMIRLWIPYPQFSADSTVGMFIQVFDAESVYYYGIAFAMLFFGTKILLHILGSMLDFVSFIPILGSINRFLGGVLCAIETYLIIFILLFVMALIPMEFIQTMLQKSIIAQLMTNYTPFLSEWIKALWINDIV